MRVCGRTHDAWQLTPAAPDEAGEYSAVYRTSSINADLFGIEDENATRHFLARIASDHTQSANFVESAGRRIGIVEFGKVYDSHGITRFNLLPAFSNLAEEIITRLTAVLLRRHHALRALYEERYHSAFERGGWELVGVRTNRLKGLAAVCSPGTAGIQVGRVSLEAFTIEEYAACLMESYRDSNDVALGLYKPFTLETFVQHVRSIFAGGEGELIPEACTIYSEAQRLGGLALVARTLNRQLRRAVVVELAVHPNKQGAGLGRVLIERTSCELWRLGFKELVLQHSFENKRARRLYERLGFAVVGEQIYHASIERGSLSLEHLEKDPQ